MLDGKHVLLVSHRPTELVQHLVHELTSNGAHVTLALRHTQDGRYLVRRLQQPAAAQLQPFFNPSDYNTPAPDHSLANAPASPDDPSSTPLTSSSTPLNMARLASVHDFAESVNSSNEPLNLVIIDTWDLYAAGSKDRRWYTPQGIAGTAQTGFIGPAVLLHLLQPKLVAYGTAVLLTASPSHRLAALDDLRDMLTSWAGSNLASTQAALLCYVRRLALQLQHRGVRAAAVDLGVLSERPLKGSLLRKLPVLRQAIHLLLPSAHDAARLLTSVATHMLSGGDASLGSMPSFSAGVAAGEAALPEDNLQNPDAAGQDATIAPMDTGAAASGQTLWDPQHTDTPALELRPDAVQAPSSSAAEPTAGLPSADALDDSDLPDVQSGRDQSAAYDLGKQFSFGKSAKAGASTGSKAIESACYVAGRAVRTAQALGASALSLGANAQEVMEGGVNNVTSLAGANNSYKPFSYISRGLLANPLVTALDHAGSSTWTSRTLHTLTAPLYDLTSASIMTAALLADWPVRTLLHWPAGLVPSMVSALGSVGAWGTRLVSQLQGLVPGVVGVPTDAPPAWVEVLPSGAVLDEKLGWKLWHLVDGYAAIRA